MGRSKKPCEKETAKRAKKGEPRSCGKEVKKEKSKADVREKVKKEKKPKLLQVKRAQLHLRDLSAAQLAAVISGLMPRLTPLQLLKIGGEILQARQSLTTQWKQQSIKTSDAHMQEKLDMMKRENGAERLWKSRLLELVRSEWASVDAAKRQEREKALTQKLVEWQGLVEKEMTTLNGSSPAPRKKPRVNEGPVSDGRTNAPGSGSRTGDDLEARPSREFRAKTEAKEAASEDSDDDADLFDKRFQRRGPASRAPSKEDPNDNDSQLSGAFGKDGFRTGMSNADAGPEWLTSVESHVIKFLRQPSDRALFGQILMADGLDVSRPHITNFQVPGN
ncbi:unnamed protein product [Symbiodinium necroappetens]|uniref:Uncharacterized protein n=1 Tax=Symbiodinium necroappetens TaxID=1628268 RepID=A0A812VLB7_9DINO|nr:unnamed protein product [Symbiodinium necroappetens]